jgi:conjugative relaxase-like TrwC/TraI family protein
MPALWRSESCGANAMMRPTAIKGDKAVGYYDALVTDEDVARKRSRVEDYYLSTDERPGVWWGHAAAELGLAGESRREDFRAVMAGRDPRSREPLGRRLRSDGVRGFDLTFSAPKSVSVLSAVCGGEIERAIVQGHDAAVRAVMQVVEERATTRCGRNGVYRVDVAGMAALLVRHRTSRALDPQLHTHAVLAAKVKSADGLWRALEATMLYRDQRALGALYQAALRAELTMRLGVVWGPVEKGQSEIAGVSPRLLEAFSRRAEQVRDAVATRAEQFRRVNGREPSRREWGIIARDAARESRPAKQRGRSAGKLRAEWCETALEQGQNPDGIERGVRRAAERQRRWWVRGQAGRVLRADGRARERLDNEVLAAMAVEASAWTRAEIEREVAARLPTVQGAGALDQVRAVQRAARELIAGRCVDLAPTDVRGVARAALDEPGVQRFTTSELIEQEQRIVRWFSGAAAAGGEPLTLGARLAVGLDPEQAQAAGLVAGTGRLVVVIGPAGAGKTNAMRAAVQSLEQQGRAVLGLAPSARAAEQLERQSALRSETVERFLTEHECPDGPSQRLQVPPGATLIVDEAGMLRTKDVERLLRVVRARRYRLALVGDSRQLAAVGRGGMFDQARAIAPLVQLREVRRLTEQWEADASLLLRECDPSAIALYDRHGRIRAGSTEEIRHAMLEDWWQAKQAGITTVLTVATNEQAGALNRLARQRLIQAGVVDDDNAYETAAGDRIGVGDEIQTRQNDRRLRTESGRWVRNRQRWRVEEIRRDGGLSVHGRGGRVILPAEYVRGHVELAYVQTVHSAQGITSQQGGTLIDELSGWRSLYVGMTRGRHHNTAYVVLDEGDDTSRQVLERALRRDRADLGVLAIQRRLVNETQLIAHKRLRELEAERHRLQCSSGRSVRERLQEIDLELEQLRPTGLHARRQPGPSDLQPLGGQRARTVPTVRR